MKAVEQFASDDDFFRWVEEFVTPAMEGHGYEVCAVGDGTTTGDDPRLAGVPSWRRGRLFRNLPMRPAPWRRSVQRHLAVGYEGNGGNEYWLYYFPERHRLNMEWWHDLLEGRADWDMDSTEPISGTELRRRLQIIGRAVAAADLNAPDE